MRDAFGGVFMIRLLLVFIVIYVAFTAISLNYAKAFRIKNKVIDFVEQEQLLSINDLDAGNGKKLAKLDDILDTANYNKTCTNGNGIITKAAGESPAYCYRGIVIEQTEVKQSSVTYNIYTYADWNLGTLNMILALGGESQNSRNIVNGAWEISGQAKVTKCNCI